MAEVQVLHPQLEESIFAVPVRPRLLHQVVVMQLASRRSGTASTKTRGVVRGSGRKPWKQKGTGRARVGSIRSPLWKGGGTIFGPQPRDYGYRLPKTARREALRSALSLKRKQERILVVDKFELEEIKTKRLRQVVEGLGVQSAIIVIAQADEKLERSARNLPSVKVLRVEGLNVYDILRFEHVVLTEPALRLIEERLVA